MPASMSKLPSSVSTSIEVRDSTEKRHARVLFAERRGQPWHHGERGRNRRDADVAGKAVPRGAHLFLHGARVAGDAPRPDQHLLAFRRQPLEARTALDQHDAQRLLELLDRRRQRRLGDAELLGSPAEMLLPCEFDEEFELVDHGRKLAFHRFLRHPQLNSQLYGPRHIPQQATERYLADVFVG